MKAPGFKAIVAGVLLLAAMAVLAVFYARRPVPPTSPKLAAKQADRAVNDRRSAQLPTGQADDSVYSQIRSAAGELSGATDLEGRKVALTNLRRALASGPTNQVSSAIRRFLDSKTDALTGQGFRLGSGGFLAEAPTLRTLLLDELGRIDAASAAAYARVILDSKDSPDEWAIALRSLAAGDPSADGRLLLQQKIQELLQFKPWQQEPSVGYLEAFDVAVFVGGTELVPVLTDLVRVQDNQALAHAAFVTLDRLAINQPLQLLGALATDPDLMRGREQTRATYFARADVRDPQQRSLLERYLLDPRTTPQELQQFAGLFPNANFMVSQNLLTASPTMDRASLVSRDAASLQVVRNWLSDPRFVNLQQPLQPLAQRLEEFTRQASR